jgi:hypothetical protein
MSKELTAILLGLGLREAVRVIGHLVGLAIVVRGTRAGDRSVVVAAYGKVISRRRVSVGPPP